MINMRDRIRTGLLSRGMPDHVADAFIMNFQDESGLNPGINEIAPTVPGSRGGFGLYQLTGPRRKAYEQYAQQRGVAPDNVDAQLDFMMTELQGPESRAAKSIFSAPDTGTAAAAIVNDFLRPAEQHRAARVARYTGGNMRQPTVSSQGQAPNPRDEVAQMFPQMPSNSLDKIAMALMSMSAFPTQGMQMQMADIKQRQGETRQQNQTNAKKNRTIETLQQRAQNGDPQAQRGIDVLMAGGSVQDAISVAFQQAQAPKPYTEQAQAAMDLRNGLITREQYDSVVSGQDDMTTTVRGLHQRALAGGLEPGSQEYRQFMIEGGAKSGMSLEVGADGSVRFGTGGASGGELTESQSKGATYATRAEGALPVLDKYETELAQFGERALNADPTGFVRGRLQSPEYQMARQAGDEFLQAILRKDTGAAITADEQTLYGGTYLPQPGDGQEVIAQKKQARRRALEALKAGMTPAAIVAQERALQNSSSGDGSDIDGIADKWAD